jgi:hypothetical protein
VSTAAKQRSAPGAAVDFLVVDEHVARNPVARAVARNRISSGTRDFMLRLYLLPEGADVAADCQVAAKVLATAIAVLEAQGQHDSPNCRVMAGAMGALVGLSGRRWKWRTVDAVALDQALQRALQVYSTASAQQLQRAYVRVAQLESVTAAN